MSKLTQPLSRWLPAVLIMLLIFYFSAQPSSDLPNFGWADFVFKKGGHMLGYALLGLSYWRALEFRKEKTWLAWALAVMYAVTDEFHQSFTAGRHPSPWDVLLFDNFGALLPLCLVSRYRKRKRPDPDSPAIEKPNV